MERPGIDKGEIAADLLYFFIAMLVSAILIFLFDAHWSFYPGETVYPPSKRVFGDLVPYYVGVPLGGLLGFFILKLIFFAFATERKAHERTRQRKKPYKKEV
ncbi:MAG TPA: hypothetical protein VJH24_01825 [Candidatus Bilamarchaeaceae archaeon]|nr:hypothetical protein [Candidatus Bilamarchaeaceae archaeon]